MEPCRHAGNMMFNLATGFAALLLSRQQPRFCTALMRMRRFTCICFQGSCDHITEIQPTLVVSASLRMEPCRRAGNMMLNLATGFAQC
jgi:hypothetical protein